MALLINSNSPPPGDWQFTIAAANKVLKSADVVSPPQPLSLDQFVRGVIRFINGNPWLLSQGYSNDFETVKTQVREHEGARMLAMGMPHLVEQLPAPTPKWMPLQQFRRSAAGAVGAIKRQASGIAAVVEWLGTGLRPVDKHISNERAKRCADCPNNDDPNWIQKFDAITGDKIRRLIEVKHDLKLQTDYDDQLKSCQVCDCPMLLKVHTPFEHIWSKTLQPEKDKLRAVKTKSGKPCWIIEESESSPLSK